MAYTVKVPGKPPRNYNNPRKAFNYYSTNVAGTWLRSNKIGRVLTRSAPLPL